MIRLTNADDNEHGQPLYVHPDDIRRCKKHKKIREITAIKDASGEWLYVTESPQEVARKVLEWKLAYQNKNTEMLYELAGLKTPWQEEEAKKAAKIIIAGLEEPNND